jgi:dihydroneopterin aldolase
VSSYPSELPCRPKVTRTPERIATDSGAPCVQFNAEPFGEPGAPESASYTHPAMRTTPGSEHAAIPDEILIEGMRFYAYHGVNPEERVLGQRFTVDVALAVDLHRAGQSDDLVDTVSYSAVFKLVRRIMEGEPRNLLEAVAEALAIGILADFPAVTQVTVTLRKPEAPVRGAMLDAVGVRLTRPRADENRLR